MNIPKTCYFYWGGTVLPYLRYMSMVSFKRLNPEWNVICFIPAQLTTTQSWKNVENKVPLNTKDYMSELKSAGIITCPFDMKYLDFSNSLSEVLKSDIIRLYLLSEHGGIWCDNDIMFFRPIVYGIPIEKYSAYFCYRRGGPTQENTKKNGPLYHSVGLLGGTAKNQYYTKLYQGVSKVLDVKQYQSIGCPYYRTVYNEENMQECPDVYNLDINTVYPTRAAYNIFTDKAMYFMNQVVGRPYCIGIHWYAGAAINGEYQNKITKETYQQYDNIVCWLVEKINQGILV